MATEKTHTEKFKQQSRIKVGVKKLLATSIGVESKKISIEHDYKENAPVITVDAKVTPEIQTKVDKTKEFLMAILS